MHTSCRAQSGPSCCVHASLGYLRPAQHAARRGQRSVARTLLHAAGPKAARFPASCVVLSRAAAPAPPRAADAKPWRRPAATPPAVRLARSLGSPAARSRRACLSCGHLVGRRAKPRRPTPPPTAATPIRGRPLSPPRPRTPTQARPERAGPALRAAPAPALRAGKRAHPAIGH